MKLRSRCIRPNPSSSRIENDVASVSFGLISGRQSHSPSPVATIRPSESCTSGLKSTRCGWFSPNWYMLVSGATPSVRDGRAQVQPRAHFHDGLVARRHVELIGAAHARRVEQREHAQRARVRSGLHDPELGEVGELLALAAHRVDGQAARRQAVARSGRERAEVARAQEHDELVFVLGPVQVVMHAKAGVVELAPRLGRKRVLAEVEVGAVVGKVPRLAVDDLVHPHARVRLGAMEEHQVERQTFGSPDRAIGPETNVAVPIVTERLELGGLGAIGRLVRRARFAPRESGDVVEVEGDRGVRARQECDREERARGASCEERRNHESNLRTDGRCNIARRPSSG